MSDAWPRDALPKGTKINGYEIVDLLGRGGFGISYRARDGIDQTFAIKECFPRPMAVRQGLGVFPAAPSEATAFNDCLVRFVKEAKALTQLSRAGLEGIVKAVTFFPANGTAYIVMEHLVGQSLDTVLKENAGGLEERQLRFILDRLLRALGHVHGAGLLHRDIKPANIFLRNDGRPVLIDFGAARGAGAGQTVTFTQIFSESYSPIEQFLGSDQGIYSDIYALGATLYRAIGGSVVGAHARQGAVRSGKPDPLVPAAQVGAGRYDPALLGAIDRALRIEPADRPQSVGQFSALLDDKTVLVDRRILDGRTVETAARPPAPQPPSAVERADRSDRPAAAVAISAPWLSRRRAGAVAAIGALLIAAGGLVIGGFDGDSSSSPASGGSGRTRLATADIPPLHAPASAKPPQKIDAALERALEARLGPSVVNISRTSASTDPAHDDDMPSREASVGTGIIVDPSGLIVTNAHVVFSERADDAFVAVTHDGTVLKADFVGWDALADLALLRVKTALPLTAARFAEGDRARVGDQILAISRPSGTDVATDIVFLHARDAEEGLYDDYLRTEGLSEDSVTGGPLVDADGEVVGIVTTARSPNGGIAAPAATAKRVIAQLMKYGKPRRGWIGVSTRAVTDELAKSAGLDRARGALIVATHDRGPAQEAGIRPGDIVLSLDGREVTGKRLPRVVSELPLGTSVKVAVWRDRRTQALDIEAHEAEYFEGRPSPGEADPLGAIGLSLSGITSELKRKFSLADDALGVVVVDVAEDSQASERELTPGDVIVEAGRQKVMTPAQVASKIDDARKDGRKGILLLVDHRGDLRFVPIRFGQG